MMLSLCAELESLGCKPVIGVFRNALKPNLDTVDHAKRLGLEHVVFNCRRRIDLSTRRAIRDYVVHNRIDVVHTHGYKADIYGYAASRERQAALVATCHSWPDRNRGSSRSLHFYGLLDKAVLKNFDIVIAVSDPLADLLHQLGIPQGRIRVIPNGVDLSHFANAAPSFRNELGKSNRPLVGMIGRLVTAKGPDVFLKAARGVLREFPETLFVLVGDGPDRERLLHVAHSLAVGANVVFAGQRSDMPAVHASLDILVLPSMSEGLPMVVLEAMAAGKAIIATEVGGIPSLIVPERTGILIKPGDAEGLQIAITRLLADPNLRKQLGKCAQAEVHKNYSSRQMADRYLDVYRQAISKTKVALKSKGGE